MTTQQMSPAVKKAMERFNKRRAEIKELQELRKRLEQCETALLKARMLLISEGDPDEDAAMIVEIDELIGDVARAALEEE